MGLPVCVLVYAATLKNGFTLNGKNLLLEILFFYFYIEREGKMFEIGVSLASVSFPLK